VKDAQEPALMVLVHCLVHYLLAETCHSKGVLKTGLLPVFSNALTKNLLVEFDSTGDGVVIPQIKTIFFL
jgi:hypothetical protein